MRINNAKNFNGDVYLTNRFSESGITVQDTSNALVFNAHSNSSNIKYFWHEPANYYGDGGEYINGFNSTSFTVGKDYLSYLYQNINGDAGEVQYTNSIGFNGDGLNIHVRYTSFGSDDNIHYRFGYNGFNLLGSSVTYVRDWEEEPNECLTINTPITIFNVGEVTFNTPDLVIVKMDNYNNSDYEKVKFDFSDTINLISNNLITWWDVDGQQNDVESAELQISNSQVNINIKNITFTTEHYSQEPQEEEYQVATINTRRYEFKYDGLYFNNHAPNTAGGFAMFDSNSRIPGMVAASKVKFDMNSNSYVLKLTLKDSSSNSLSSDIVDLPLESMVVNGRYDSNSKNVVLTLKNGNEVSFSVADLVNGLQKSLTAKNGITIDSNSNIFCNGHIVVSDTDDEYPTYQSKLLMTDHSISLNTQDSALADSCNFTMNTNGYSFQGNSQMQHFIQYFDGEGVLNFVVNNDMYNEEHVRETKLSVSESNLSITSRWEENTAEQGDEENWVQYSNSFVFTNQGDIKINNHSINQAQGLVQLDSNSLIPDTSYQHIEKTVKTLSGYITDNVVTIDDLAPGLVVAVINDTGKQVYPDIQYVNGRAVITADFETNSPDTSWAIFKVNYLTF